MPIKRRRASSRAIDVGNGPPLILIPSMLVRADSYLWALRKLCTRFRVIVPILPGSGEGERLRRPWEFDDYARWAAATMDSLRIERATIIGHSNSGPVALRLALDFPDRVSRLVLVDTIGADESHSLIRVLWGRTVDAALEPKLTLWGFHHVLYNAMVHPRNFFHEVRLSYRTDITTEATRLNVPTLLAWGARDHTMPTRCFERLRQIIPDVKTYVSNRGSHDWLLTHAREFADAVYRFVEQSSVVTNQPPYAAPNSL